MDSISDRIQEMGLTLPEVPRPVANYVPAVVHGDLCFTSGQLPLVDGRLVATGRVGDQLGWEEAKQAARVAALNALSAAAAVAGGIDALAGVLRVTGYVQTAPGFYREPQVIDGASELYRQVFGDSGNHVRSAVGVASLPLNAPVEIACVFRLAAYRDA